MKKLFLLIPMFIAVTQMQAQWSLTGNAATSSAVLGTTNSIPLRLITKNVQRFVIDTSGRVGIGMAAPPNVLSVKGSGGTPAAVWVSAGAPLFTGFGEQTVGNADYILSMASSLSNARPVFIGRRSKGTLAAPLTVANNDNIMSFLSSAYDGTAFQNPASIDFYVDGTPAAGSVPARISFVTGSNSTNRAERLKIGNTGDITMNTNQLFVQKSTGNVGIGTVAPMAKLEVKGDALINSLTVGRGGGNDITNTSIGYKTLETNIGNNNTANGSQALFSNTNGALNTANGSQALYTNTNGYSNTANGTYSLYSNITGNNNTANGQGSLYSNTLGNDNTATGKFALTSNTSGNANTANGVEALYSNNVGINNTANGNRALYSNGSGNYNTATGNEALKYNTTGDNNTANGSFSLFDNSTGSNNTANGYGALSSNYTGSANTASGKDALYFNTSGDNNTANGKGALYYNTTGTLNTATGKDALYFNYAGNYNTANGMNALFTNATGSSNTANGINALYSNSSGNDNTAEGRDALYYATGNQNTAIGRDALIGISTGDNNIGVGYSAQVPVAAGSNQVSIGNGAITYAGVQVAWSITSDKRLKKDIQKSNLGLAFIQQLNPVSYVRKNDKSNKTEYGFIAQELETALKSAGAENSGIITKSDSGMYSVRYNDLLAPIVKGMQELSKANEQLTMNNEQLKKAKAEQESVNKTLQQQINELKALMTGPTAKPVAAINQKEVSFETATLGQNVPNPPSGNFTRINYNIPTGAARAEMMIVDNAGRKIKTISLNTFGKGVLNVDTKGLATGTYSYSMIVDGKVIDTKQMVVVK